MDKKCLLSVFLVQIIFTEAAFNYVGANLGIGNNGFYIGGGINIQTPPYSYDSSSSSSLENAYTALQSWKTAITDDPSGVLRTWVGSNVCSYKGVFCADDDKSVSGIDLNNANLQGTLVEQLSLLKEISIFHINSNRFSGSVPDSFRDLSSLQELDLSNNLFSGFFPSVTLSIQNLKYLDVRFNNFSGPISDEIFNKNLDAIFLNNNHFSGQIPQNLGNSPASVINLANNQFTGNIPASFGYMGSTLKEILFLNNKLTGCIPQGFGFLTQVQVLDLSFNSLMGHLPDTFSCLSEIEVLNLGHNKLSGELSDVVCSLRSLLNLTVAYNFFSGFSQDCTRLYFGKVFDFELNCIPGRDMQRPGTECSGFSSGGLSCMRIPSVHVCGSIGANQVINPSP